jgi:hypothetical protein
MALHCAGRLGLLDFIYAKRSVIAYAVGITAEKAIASCGLGHYQQESLALADDNDHEGFPISSQTLEINLFFHESFFANFEALPIYITDQFFVGDENTLDRNGKSLFHPPSILV